MSLEAAYRKERTTMMKKIGDNKENDTFKTDIENEELSNMPRKNFEGNITVVDSLQQIPEVADFLEKHDILGFDTETRPAFKKGVKNKVALLQLSTLDRAFLFRLNKIGIPERIASILASEMITKVGVAVHDDLKGLKSIQYFEPQGFVDLQSFVRKYGIESSSLKKISAVVLNFTISKRQQLSNWEADDLALPQQTYAATDAWVALAIYRQLLNHPEINQ